MPLFDLSFISASAPGAVTSTSFLNFLKSSLTGNVVGIISLIITSISLHISWKGYVQAQQAATEAQTAAAKASEASEKLDAIQRYEELGNEIKNELTKTKEFPKDLDKAYGYIAILTRLKENQNMESSEKGQLAAAIYSLNRRLPYMGSTYYTDIQQNTMALANAEGLINACIDQLQRKG